MIDCFLVVIDVIVSGQKLNADIDHIWMNYISFFMAHSEDGWQLDIGVAVFTVSMIL